VDHHDHVNLLRRGLPAPGGTWADFGAGGGAFTLALADLAGPSAVLHAIDTNAAALRANAREMAARFPATTINYHTADFTRPLELPPLDGIVIANALHFQREQPSVVRLLRSYLSESGRILIVEYNTTHANFAVPHPVPYTRWQTLALDAGFAHTELLATRPSRFLGEIYSAASR
jgi:ubiquinone/menaquinone biosynthesis C-methylase UbiE